VRKVLCAVGTGPHAELLALSSRTFHAYADRHGYDVELRHELLAPDRPASWSKVLLVQELLRSHDVVFCIDADAAIVDPSHDIVDDLRDDALIGLVAHEYDGQRIPNCGVWVLRRDRKTSRFLAKVWRQTQYLHHKWWENAAVLELLGYRLEPTVELVKPRRMLGRVQFLDQAWNSIAMHESPHPWVRHYPGETQEHRLAHLRADVAALEGRTAGGSGSATAG
jgi:hypothetical protein